MRMKEALRSGIVLKALEQLAKVPNQCNDLGNLHMKYKFRLIYLRYYSDE